MKSQVYTFRYNWNVILPSPQSAVHSVDSRTGTSENIQRKKNTTQQRRAGRRHRSRSRTNETRKRKSTL